MRIFLITFAGVIPVLAMAGCTLSARTPLLNPSLRGIYNIPFSPLRTKIADRIEAWIKQDDADHVSVYFQVLPTGYWFGINEYEDFIPASLLKIHLLITVLKEAEKDPSILSKKITLVDIERAATDLPHAITEPEHKQKTRAGEVYTVDELLFRMISHSDNNAAYNLQYSIPEGSFELTLKHFGITLPESEYDFITVKQYMMTILALYNSTYLSPDMSQKALGYMSKSGFDSGLAAGVPKGTVIANKFGERRTENNGKYTFQLHDCGIIYHPELPYLLGIMTRGKDQDKLKRLVAEISAIVYAEVALRVRNRGLAGEQAYRDQLPPPGNDPR